jgi:broad-specificity NMP kinase
MKKWSIIKKIFKEAEKRKIINTDHALERFEKRYVFISKEKIKELIQDVSIKILDDYKDKEGVYGWHSKSTGAGGIINWRPDIYTPQDKKNHAIIATLFPIKKYHTYKDVDAILIIENQIIEWAKEKGFGKRKIEENLCELFTEKHDEYINSFYVAFFEGELNDFHLNGYILIN